MGCSASWHEPSPTDGRPSVYARCGSRMSEQHQIGKFRCRADIYLKSSPNTSVPENTFGGRDSRAAGFPAFGVWAGFITFLRFLGVGFLRLD
jgi:hypothetical protein